MKSQNCPEGLRSSHDYSANKRYTGLRKLRKDSTKVFVQFCCKLVPTLYRLWMSFVFATSKIRTNKGLNIDETVRENPKMVVAMWHQDVFSAPYLFRRFGAYALANTSELGNLITAVLEKNNFRVFRGGRKRRMILRDMITYMSEQKRAIYGLTVDGSRGPARKMKRGACIIARECGAPIFLVSTQARYQFRCPTWDRMVIFFPFNRIETRMIGPFWLNAESSEAEFDQHCSELESRLNKLEDEVRRAVI